MSNPIKINKTPATTQATQVLARSGARPLAAILAEIDQNLRLMTAHSAQTESVAEARRKPWKYPLSQRATIIWINDADRAQPVWWDQMLTPEIPYYVARIGLLQGLFETDWLRVLDQRLAPASELQATIMRPPACWACHGAGSIGEGQIEKPFRCPICRGEGRY